MKFVNKLTELELASFVSAKAWSYGIPNILLRGEIERNSLLLRIMGSCWISFYQGLDYKEFIALVEQDRRLLENLRLSREEVFVCGSFDAIMVRFNKRTKPIYQEPYDEPLLETFSHLYLEPWMPNGFPEAWPEVYVEHWGEIEETFRDFFDALKLPVTDKQKRKTAKDE